MIMNDRVESIHGLGRVSLHFFNAQFIYFKGISNLLMSVLVVAWQFAE